MSNTAELKLKGTSDFTKISSDLKTLATDSKTAGSSLTTLGSNLDKGAKSTQTFGQKLKGFGSNFGGLATNVATLGGTVVNLSRQYSDLGDSQIRVDKAQRKVSTTTEAARKAQSALNTLVAKGVTSGADYEQASLDLEQALSAQKTATDLLGEAQEDAQRAQENFWLGLGPTVTSAGSTVMSTISSITGGKGIGGLKTAFEGLGGKGKGLIGGIASGLGSLIPSGLGQNLTSIGTGGTAAGAGLTALSGGANAAKLSLGGLLGVLGPVAALIGGFAAGEGLKNSGAQFSQFSDSVHKGVLELMRTFGASEEQVKAFDDAMRSAGNTIGAHLPAYESQAKTTGTLADANTRLAHATSEYVKALGTAITEDDEYWANQVKIEKAEVARLMSVNNLAQGTTSLGTATSNLGARTIDLSDALGVAFPALEREANAINLNDALIAPWILKMDELNQRHLDFVDTLNTTEQVANLNANAWQNDQRRLAELDKVLKQATQSMKGYNSTAAKAVHLTNQLPFSASLSGPRNPNYRVRSDYQKPLIGSAFAQRQMLAGTRPRNTGNIKLKTAQSGMNELLQQDTIIMAHKDEHIRITPPGKGGGGGMNVNVNVFLDGEKLGSNNSFVRKIRYEVNANQGIFK